MVTQFGLLFNDGMPVSEKVKKRSCSIACDVCPMSALCADMGLSVVEIVPEIYDGPLVYRVLFMGNSVPVFYFRTIEGLLDFIKRVPIPRRGHYIAVQYLPDRSQDFTLPVDIVGYADQK